MNGVSNGHSSAALQWKVGLVNYANKYLTAETFGFKVNVTGAALKKKQTWTLEQDLNEEVVYIKSHLGKYLSADKYGNITCDAGEDEFDASAKFVIEYATDGSGKWHFRNVQHGNYLGGTDENLKCFAKTPTNAEQWTVQLSIHPQVHLQNVNRRRYAHLNNDEIQCTEVTPWGQDALIILEFVDGKYALKTCDNRYLHKNGHLVENLDNDSLFSLAVKSGQHSGLAFQDSEGRYLTAVGSTASMKGRNKTITKDELFTIEDSHPQIILIAYTGKKVSTKQGVDITANQDEETDNETFQAEYVKSREKWAFKTIHNKYWTFDQVTSGVQDKSSEIKAECLFDLEWQGDGSIALKACNGLYIFNKQTGCLLAQSTTITDKEKFKVKIVNRPLLVLKSEHGFVGQKTSTNLEYCCNRATYNIIFMEPSPEGGSYRFKGTNGKYWSLTSDNTVNPNSDSPVDFILEFQPESKLTIKAPNGKFLKGEQNGLFRALAEDQASATLWEY